MLPISSGSEPTELALADELQALRLLSEPRRGAETSTPHLRAPRLALTSLLGATSTREADLASPVTPTHWRRQLSTVPDSALTDIRQQAQQLAELLDMREALLATRSTQIAPTADVAPTGAKGKAQPKGKGKGRSGGRADRRGPGEPRSDAPNLALLSSRLDNAVALYQRLSVERARALGQLESSERRLQGYSQALVSARQELQQSSQSREGMFGTVTGPDIDATPDTIARLSGPSSPVFPERDPAVEAIRAKLESLTASDSLAVQDLNKHRKEIRKIESDLRLARRELELHTQPGNLPDIVSTTGDFQVVEVLRRESLPDRSIFGERVHEADYELFLRHFAEPVLSDEEAVSTASTSTPSAASTEGSWRIKPQFLDLNQADRHPLIAIISALSQVATPNKPPSASLLTNFSLLPPGGGTSARSSDPLGYIGQQPDVTQRRKMLQDFLVARLDILLASERRVQLDEAQVLQSTASRRVRVSRNTRLSRTQMRVTGERWQLLCALMERHRELFVQDLARTLWPLIEAKSQHVQGLRALVSSLEAQLRQLRARTPQQVEEAVTLRRQLNAVRDELRESTRQRQQGRQSTPQGAVQDTSVPPPRGPSSSSSSWSPVLTRSDTLFRLEAKIAQIQGRVSTQAPLVDRAREDYESARQALMGAEESVRIAEAQLEQGMALHTQYSGSRHRARRLQQEDIDQVRQEQMVLDARIRHARHDLMGAETLSNMITPEALARAIERHVEPNHQALRERATQVGRATAYSSEAHLVVALTDIHQHLNLQAQRDPSLADILSARTRAEFEQAVAQRDDRATDMLFEHTQTLGHGFADALDQTDRPTPVRHSSYSLIWRARPDGTQRIQVSHLHPYLPPRTLRVLERSTSFQ